MNKNNFLQDNIIYMLIPVLVLAAGIYFGFTKFNELIEKKSVLEQKQEQERTKRSKLTQLLAAKKKLEQIEEIRANAPKSDAEIDLSDIPEITHEEFVRAIARKRAKQKNLKVAS